MQEVGKSTLINLTTHYIDTTAFNDNGWTCSFSDFPSISICQNVFYRIKTESTKLADKKRKQTWSILLDPFDFWETFILQSTPSLKKRQGTVFFRIQYNLKSMFSKFAWTEMHYDMHRMALWISWYVMAPKGMGSTHSLFNLLRPKKNKCVNGHASDPNLFLQIFLLFPEF